MWYPVLAQQEVLAERKQAAFLLAESVLMAAPSGSSQVQTVPCWQEIVQATVVLPVLLSQQVFLLLMFPVRARIGLPARGEQPAAFRVSPKLDGRGLMHRCISGRCMLPHFRLRGICRRNRFLLD